ncbi:MAG: phosphoribosyltransferase family protein [Acidimicrobiales bacterium]|jgi:hypoxanthine phosphoribosyltransferase
MSQPGLAGRTLLETDELSSIVRRFGEAISADHPDGIVLVGILKGSVCLVADLAREISVPCAVDFLALSAYGAGGARIKLSKDLEADVAGRAVVIAVDIVDSGLTVSYVRRLLNERGARSADVCTLLDRRPRRLLPVDLRYVGLEIGDEYVVGYGLDFEERYRNLPMLVVVEPESLRSGASPQSVGRIASVQGLPGH